MLSPPRLRSTGEVGERTTTWLEGFFDLVFAIAITQLGVVLAGSLTLDGFLRFALLLVPVWWSWIGYTNYADRFDSDDLEFRLLFLGAMLGMAAVAVAIPSAFTTGGSVAFAAAYAGVRAVLVVLYLRARHHVPEARALCDVTIAVFVVGIVLWLLSLFAPEPWRFAFWGAALLIEGATPWVARRAMASVPYHAGHLPERYGLFTLIVLGESLVAVVVGTHAASWHAQSILVATCGFLIAAGLWWLYFGSIDRAAVRRSLLARNTFIYCHLFVALGLAMVSVGIMQTIVSGGPPASGGWTLPAGVACFLAALVAVRVATTRTLLEPALLARLAVAAASVGLAVAAGALTPLLVAAPVALALCGLVVVDLALRRDAAEG